MNPNVVIIAGPNGSGKSTSAPELVYNYLGITEFVNADVIATGLSAFDSSNQSIEAGRIMLHQLTQLVSRNENFAFETTLASRTFANSAKKWKAMGYHVHLFFMWLPSPELAIARVRARVETGGHDISDSVVRRRYERGLSNLVNLYIPIVNQWRVYDCTTLAPQIIAIGNSETSNVSKQDIWNQIMEYQHD